jgi:hypothetical protein
MRNEKQRLGEACGRRELCIEVSAAKCTCFLRRRIGQGMGTVLTQFVKEITGLRLRSCLSRAGYALAPNSEIRPLPANALYGEATVRAANILKSAMEQSGGLEALEGQSFTANRG